jgi:hypothetical protein
MEVEDAVLRILEEEGGALHWTVIQDLALRRGYLDPFTQPNLRREVLRALNRLARDAAIRREDTGVYASGPPGVDPAGA